MPLFDFECMECGFVFEKIRRSGETVICPKCNRCEVRQLIGASTFKINGHNESNGYSYQPNTLDKIAG